MSDDFVDYVETSVIEGDPDAPAKPKGPELVQLPQSVIDELKQTNNVLGTEEKEKKEKLDQATKQQEIQRAKADLEKQVRLQKIKTDEVLLTSAGDFLKDMAGVEPMQRTYTAMGFVKMRFRVMDSKMTEEITQQNVRDIIVGRIRFTSEVQYLQFYRLAGSLVELTITDPQEADKVLKQYDFEASANTIAEYKSEDLVDTDLMVRRRATYVAREMLNSAPLYHAVLNSLSDFEHLLSDLAFLAAEDPDFFQKCLTGAA